MTALITFFLYYSWNRCETLRNEQSATSSSSSLQGTDGYRNGVTDLEDPPRDKKNSTVGSLCGLATIAEHKGWVSKQVSVALFNRSIKRICTDM